MTEAEKLQRAKLYMDKLANGIDPITDTEIPGDSILNNVMKLQGIKRAGRVWYQWMWADSNV